VLEISSLNAPWTIEYISNTEESLPANTGLLSARMGTHWRLEDQSITEEIWIRASGLPFDYEPIRWDTLLLDAQQVVSQVGPALVLAVTAVKTAAAAVIGLLFTNLPSQSSYKNGLMIATIFERIHRSRSNATFFSKV
jgi:hypothetical protein